MPAFRKKPLVVQAVQWLGPRFAIQEDWVPPLNPTYLPAISHVPSGQLALDRNGVLYVGMLEGTLTVSPGDWLVRGVENELYPVKSRVFDRSYESA